MHEVGIMQETLALAIRQATAARGQRIHALRLKVGEWSGVVPEALQFAFEVLRQGTEAEGATLEIEVVPATCWCSQCQREFAASDLAWECPICQHPSLELRQGRELELSSLEIS
jgi:hydrogenase nickel incorporation protein HypA/HybF